jgi:general secretion pathway protein N
MKRLIFLGLIVFLAVMVVTFPARVAYTWFAPTELQLSGIEGSIWNGSAAEGFAAGAYIQNINWQFIPLALLSGNLAYHTSSNPASGSMTSNVAVGMNGELTLSNLTGNLPLDLVHPAFQQNGIRGDISLQFDSVVINNGMPSIVVGSVTVSDFFVPDLSTSTLGDFRADDFQTADGIVIIKVEDVDAVVDVAGTITISLNTDRSYAFIGTVAPTSATPASIVNQLVFLGSANEDGQHDFRFEGQL